VSREVHAGFWESAEGRFLCATRRVPRSCMKDERRSLGVRLQEQASNHLKLHWLRAFVVSVKEKAWQKTVSGVSQGDE